MKHFVKTLAGISKDYYTHSSDFPKFGKGQDKTSSSPTWMFISSTLLAILHSLCAGINLTSACGKFRAKQVAELYVNDTDAATVKSNRISCSPDMMQDRLQVIAQTWEQLLFGS
eukprot:6104662-Ditylum_brightwellii.AAC.1